MEASYKQGASIFLLPIEKEIIVIGMIVRKVFIFLHR